MPALNYFPYCLWSFSKTALVSDLSDNYVLLGFSVIVSQ